MAIQKVTNNTNPILKIETYEFTDIISPMFDLNHQIIVSSKTKLQKITSKTNQTTNYSASNDTIIITIDLLVDDILDEK